MVVIYYVLIVTTEVHAKHANFLSLLQIKKDKII